MRGLAKILRVLVLSMGIVPIPNRAAARHPGGLPIHTARFPGAFLPAAPRDRSLPPVQPIA